MTFKVLSICVFLFGCTFAANAQDTTRTAIGYDIDYPHLYVRVDTIHHHTYLYNYYGKAMYFTIGNGDAFLVKNKAVFMVWRDGDFILTVTRKKYKRIYQF